MKNFATRKFFLITSLVLLCMLIASVTVVASNTLTYKEKCTKIENEKRELINEKIIICNDLYIARNDIKALEDRIKELDDEVEVKLEEIEFEKANYKKIMNIFSQSIIEKDNEIETLKNEIAQYLSGNDNGLRKYFDDEFRFLIEFPLDWQYQIYEEGATGDGNDANFRKLTLFFNENTENKFEIWGSETLLVLEQMVNSDINEVIFINANNIYIKYAIVVIDNYNVILGIINDNIAFKIKMTNNSFSSDFSLIMDILNKIKVYS